MANMLLLSKESITQLGNSEKVLENMYMTKLQTVYTLADTGLIWADTYDGVRLLTQRQYKKILDETGHSLDMCHLTYQDIVDKYYLDIVKKNFGNRNQDEILHLLFDSKSYDKIKKHIGDENVYFIRSLPKNTLLSLFQGYCIYDLNHIEIIPIIENNVILIKQSVDIDGTEVKLNVIIYY